MILATRDFVHSLGQPRASAAWLAKLRAEALATFHATGFPTLRDEAWKGTSVEAIASTQFAAPVLWKTAPGRHSAFEGAYLCVLQDGIFRPEVSKLPPAVHIGRLASGLEDGWLSEHLGRLAGPRSSAFVALNTAFFEDAIVVRIPRGVHLPEPIHILFHASGRPEPTAIHARVVVLLERDAQATIVEEYRSHSDATYLTNAVTEILLSDNSSLQHTKIVSEGRSAYHVGATHVLQQRNSNLSSHVVDLGGKLVRNELSVVLADLGANASLDGLFVVDGHEHVDNHTRLDHSAPHCSSRELYKGILDGHGRGVFTGAIVVRPDAQKTDSWQLNNNLVLSGDALVDSTPQLEILADDVKCKHGSTIGQLEDEALFYMQSRGIARGAAVIMLTHAFAQDIVNRIQNEAVRKHVSRAVRHKLGAVPELEEAFE